MKKNRIFNALVLAASLILLNTSCEVGLGASVDVDAPTLSITYPEQGSVIRENFIIYGECGDDKGISHINVTVNHMNGEKATVIKTFKATLDETQTTWQANINDWLGEGKGYNGWELADGNYVIDVNAIDFSGRDSGIASLSVDIDNTVPIFIIKSPTSKKITSPTSYGTSFKITGTMTDDHTVSKMIIKVYDKTANFDDPENPPVPLETIYESNIDTTTEVVVANRNREGDLRNRYNKFYEGTTEGENCPLWCTVEMEDNAKIYRNPGEAENTSRGNVTNRFYIVDEVNSTWASSDKDMDPGKVKKIVNKTATGISSSLADEVMKLYNENAVTQAAFSINSDSNPTYEIRNFGNSETGNITKSAAAQGSVSFSLSPGRNGDNVCPSSVKVFLWGPFDDPATTDDIAKMYSSDLSVVEQYAKQLIDSGKVRILAYMDKDEYVLHGTTETISAKYKKEDGTIDTNGVGGSVPNYDREITLPDTISTGKIYYISANALDLADSVANPSYDVFAFKGHSSGQPPAIKCHDTGDGENIPYDVCTIEDDGITGKQKIVFSGIATYADGIEDFAEITCRYSSEEYNFENEKNTKGPAKSDYSVTEITKDEEKNRVYWKYSFDVSSIPNIDDGRLIYYDFVFTAKGLSETQSNLHRRVTVDTKKPRLNITSVYPVVQADSKKYLNGNVNFDAKITDKNLSKVWYNVYCGDSDTLVYESGKFGEDSYSLNEVIKTTLSKFDSYDKKTFKIELWAEDKAGNKASVVTTKTKELDGDAIYTLDQSKDMPVVTPNFKYTDKQNPEPKDIVDGGWYGKNAKINFSVSDDDGLASVTIKKNNESAKTQSISVNTTNASINYELPNEKGLYQITLVATDNTYGVDSVIANRQTTWGPYTVGVDIKNPELTDNNSFTQNYAKDSFTVQGTIDDDIGIKSLTVTAKKDDSKSVSIDSTFDTNSKTWKADVSKGDLPDGKYTFTTKATDYAGNESEVASVWTVDVNKPTINSAKITTTEKYAENSYSTDKLEITVNATDGLSGVTDVQFSTDNSVWTSLSSITGTNDWKGSVPCAQGTNTISIKAIDEAGNESEVKKLTAKVDTEAPDNIELKSVDSEAVSTDGITGFTGTKLVNNKKDIPFTVSIKDANGSDGSGINKVTVKIGEKEVSGNGNISISNSEDIYTITFKQAYSIEKSGMVSITVTDKAGNSASPKDLFYIELDKDNPRVEIKSVTPVVTNESTKYVNGEIKIVSRIEDSYLSKKWYVINDGTTPQNEVKDSEPGYEFTIDTTKYAKNDTLNITVWAEDKAGNKGSVATAEYVVDQDTDKPVIKGNGFTYVDASKTKKDVTSWYDASGKLLASVSDDDGLQSVTVQLNNNTAESQSITAGSLTANIDYTLPGTDGVYKILISAVDITAAAAPSGYADYRKNTYGPFLIGVDTADPELTEDHSTGTNIVRDNIVLTGQAKDQNGIRTINVTVKNTKTNSNVATYEYDAEKTDGNTITLTNDQWKCITSLEDGNYLITTVAKDYAGKEKKVESSFIKDNVAPKIESATITTANTKTIGGKLWYVGSSSIDVEVVASDATSDVANVQYSLDGNNWSDFAKGTGKWTATIKCEQNANTIRIKAIDGSGKESSTQKEVNIDTSAPETLELVSVAGETSFSGVKMVNGKNDLSFVINAKDEGTGIQTVAVKVGTKTITGSDIIIASPSNGQTKYTITLKKSSFTSIANLSTSAVSVKLTDKAGKSTDEKALFSITKDSEAPKITVSSVLPVVTKGSQKQVNGTIKVTAKIDDTYLSNVWYEIKGTKNSTASTISSGDKGPVTAIEIPVNTTEYDDDSTIEVEIHAVDQAGNESPVVKASSINGTETPVSFTVNQASDKPVVTPSNFTKLVAQSNTKEDIPETEWFNASGNNKLIATVEDDDSLSSVTIIAKDASGNSIAGITEQQLVPSGTTPSTVNVKYVLPSTDGVYQITINAIDTTFNEQGITTQIKNNRKLEYGPFIVGVDTASPSITETHSTGKNYVAENFTVDGTTSDANGIKEIVVEVFKGTETTATKTYKYSESKVTYPVQGTTDGWSCTIPNADLGEGTYKVKSTVKDFAGKTNTVESEFIKDTTAPKVTFDGTNSQAPTKVIDENNWYNTDTISIVVNASDDGSGVSSVEYAVNGTSSWSPLRQGTTDATKNKWTANVTLPNQGENKIYIKATDKAGKVSKINPEYRTVYIDNKKPEVCTLNSIDGDTNFSTKKLANGNSDVKFIVTAKDYETAAEKEKCSGVSKVELITVGTTLSTAVTATSKGSDQYEITVPASSIENGSVVVKVYDELENYKEYTLFTFQKDTTAPKVTIDSISDAEDKGSSDYVIDVNKTITFSGTASDEKELKDVYLYYATETDPTKPTASLNLVKSWTDKGWTKLDYEGSKYAWKASLNTVNLNKDNKNLYFYAVAVDTAGNSYVRAYSEEYSGYQLKINQDSDRPKVILSNLCLTKEDTENEGKFVSNVENNYYWHTESNLQGRVEDDDGTIKEFYWSKTGADNSWTVIPLRGTWSISGFTEGENTIYFKVVDAAGETFVSAANGMAGPKVIDKNEQDCLGFTNNKNEILKVKVDTKNPEVGTLYGYVSSSDTYDASKAKTKLSEIGTVGGTNKYLFVKVTSEDDNGIASVKVTVNGSNTTKVTGTGASTSDNTTYVARFDLSTITQTTEKIGNKPLKVVVRDNAGKEYEDTIDITVDNVKPTVSYITQQGVQLYGSQEAIISGKSDDKSEITKLWYAVTKNTTEPDKSAYTEVAYTPAKDDQIARDNWSIIFDGGTSTTTEFHTNGLNELYSNLDPEADLDTLTNVDMYLWIIAEDVVGNESEATMLKMNVIPNSSVPRVDISYPLGEKAIGGIIRVTGTVELETDTVSKVYMQIDPNYNGTTFNTTGWKAALNEILTTKSIQSYQVVSTGLTDDYSDGILVSGTNSWSQAINVSREFQDKLQSGKYRTLAIRVFAVTKTSGRVSAFAERIVPIDPNSPVFGNLDVDDYTEMQLVQYDTGTFVSGTSKVTVRQEYKDDIYLKGQWYLKGSISDESGILNATIKMPGNENATPLITEGVIKNASYVSELGSSSDGKGKNYVINIPVGNTTDDVFGNLSYEIYIQDCSGSKSENTRTFTVNYDNRVPEFAISTEVKNKIYQSDGTYTLAGTFDETSSGTNVQSGFSRIVMYFTNVRSDVTNLIDPMISKGSSGTANRESVEALNNSDGLYWRKAEVANVTNGSMTVSKLDNSDVTEVTPKVRAGGLCKVDGVIYRIKYASGTTVVLDDGIVSKSESVYFAAGALVIDNETQESGTKTSTYDISKTAENGKDEVQTAGDGDQMMEKATSQGTRTNWSVSIDSTQILDGQVTVHLVAFDKAGNSTVITQNALVMNNAPRFAGVKFGADLDCSNSVDDSEMITEFAEQYVLTNASDTVTVGRKRDGSIVDELVVSDDYRLPIKKGFKVIPVIVGGNNGLKWKMTYKDTASASVTTAAADYGVGDSSDVVRNWGTDPDAANYKTVNDDTFKIEYGAIDLLKLNNKGIASGDQDLVFTIEDKTESGAIPATLTVPVTVMLADNSKPVAKWKPLYWKSSSDNSLYNNSQSNGHIELAEDWANSSRKAEINYGTNDADSKVSGIISMEGYATDNVLVNSITVNVDGTNYTLSRDETGWTTSTAGRLMTSADYSTYDLTTNPWYFEVVSDSFDSRIYLDDEKTKKNPQYGYNIVTFKFHWNTAKLLASNKKAKKDVQVSVTASDKGPTKLNSGKTATEYETANKSTVGTAKTTKDAETNLYQLDVVPYITKVYTELAALQKREAKWSKTSRSSNGAYPVRITTKTVDGATGDCETVSFYGFNLTGAQYTDGRSSGAATTALGTGSKLSYVTAPYDVVTLSVDKIISSASSYSGEVNLAVDGVYTINNVNNNDAKGSVTVALTDANCGTYGYNRQPNSDNNKKLTDDVRFDVWQINGAAATPGQGRLDQPVMSINPVTDWIGFGFADGPATFSMGGANRGVNGNKRSWSYYQWQMSYDQFTSIAFAYDAWGHSYGTAAGGDISSDTLDRYVLCTSRDGSPDTLALDDTYKGSWSTRLEKIGQNSMDTTNKQRIKSPSIATATHGDSSTDENVPTPRTNLYLAYYDAIHGEIRLRYGSNTSENYGNFDSCDDFTENDTDVTDDKVQAKNLNYKSIIANTSTKDASGNDASAGEYLSIAVISAEGTANADYDDKLVAIWYNPQTKSLWYSYNASPSAARADGATTGNRGSWSTPVRVFAVNSTMAAAGQYCKMVADKKGGLHIAAYDPENLDLCYAYLAPGNVASATTAKFNTAVVDSKDVVGSNLSIDVALDAANGNPVPSIGYYATESGKPMYAYLYNKTALTDTTGKLNGAVKDMYTGTWECSAVPTGDVVDLNSKQFNMINVGLHKTAITGVLKTSIATSVTQKDATATYNHGLVFGNGTNNAVLGYAVKHGGGSNNVETAQKR